MFENREKAGELLAKRLKNFKEDKDAVVLGVTRGGVVVAKIIAGRLNLPLDIIVVKKIGYPQNPELAIGAVGPPATQDKPRLPKPGTGGQVAKSLRAGPKKTVYWNKGLIRKLKIGKDEMLELQNEKQQEQEKQEKILRNGRFPKDLKNKIVIVVDDGIATGASAILCSYFLDKEGVKKKILVTPVISKDTFNNISRYFDRVISLKISDNFFAVGEFYKHFPQVENDEVIKLLS